MDPERKESRPVLVISGGPTTQPLWRGLSDQFDLCFVMPQSAQLATEMKLPGVSALGQLADGELQERANNRATLLSAQLVNLMPEISRRFTDFYPDEPTPDLLNGHLDEWWAGYFAMHARSQVGLLETLARLMESRRVAGFLTHEDVTPDMRAVTLFFRARGRPTFHLPHAACHLRPGVQDIHREARAEYVLSSGSYMTGFYSESGVAPEKIIPVGIPQNDRLYQTEPVSKAEARRVLDIQAERVILYGTTWQQTTSLRSRRENELDDALAAVIKIARERDAYLAIGMHPGDADQNAAYYAAALEQAGLDGLVTRSHTDYLIRAADVLVELGPSNFCVWAATLGLPSCYIQTEDFDYAHPLPPRGDASSLGRLIDEALSGAGDWQDFVATYNCAHPGGGATERALDAIMEIVNARLGLQV